MTLLTLKERSEFKLHNILNLYTVSSKCCQYTNTLVRIVSNLVDFQPINHFADFGGYKPNFNKLLTWPHSTPLQSFIRNHSKLFKLLCLQTEWWHTRTHTCKHYQKHNLVSNIQYSNWWFGYGSGLSHAMVLTACLTLFIR